MEFYGHWHQWWVFFSLRYSVSWLLKVFLSLGVRETINGMPADTSASVSIFLRITYTKQTNNKCWFGFISWYILLRVVYQQVELEPPLWGGTGTSQKCTVPALQHWFSFLQSVLLLSLLLAPLSFSEGCEETVKCNLTLCITIFSPVF